MAGYDEGFFNDLADVNDVAAIDLADVGRGFMQRPQMRRPGMAAQMSPRPNIPRRVLIPQTPGVPSNGLRQQPLGLGATSFTATSGTALSLSASPQRPFKGLRIVIDTARTGTTSTGLVTITALNIGTVNQFVGSGAVSVTTFAATSFDTNVSLDPAVPGIQIVMNFAISVAPSSSDRVDISGTIMGMTVG